MNVFVWQLRFNNLPVVTINTFFFYLFQSPCASHPCKNGGTCIPNYMKNFYNCLCGESFLGNNCERGNFKTSFFFKFLNLNLLINWPSCIFSGFNSIHLLSYFLYSCCDDFHVLFEFSIFIYPLIPKSGWLVFLLVASPLHVTKIKEIITNLTSSSMSNKFSFPVP